MRKQDFWYWVFLLRPRLFTSSQVDEAFRPFLPPKFEVLFSWKKPFFESNVPLALCSLASNISLYNNDEVFFRHEEAPFELSSTLGMLVAISSFLGEADVTKAIQDSFWKDQEEGRPMSDHVDIFLHSLVIIFFLQSLECDFLLIFRRFLCTPGPQDSWKW